MMAHVRITAAEFEIAERAGVAGDVGALTVFLKKWEGNPDIESCYFHSGFSLNNSPEENARQIITRKHCFNSWEDYEAFNETMKDPDSVVAKFERAADAVVNGDAATLKRMLADDPWLITARSARSHHSTLLIYVGANGFEGYRQKTPENAAEIAEILLGAGAEVDAMGDMYGGATTLGLVATSVHPVITGVQEELMEVLFRYGAGPDGVAPDYTDGSLILACLHNGRTEPIEHLAKHGAKVNLEAAGGIGDLDKMKSYFTPSGELTNGATTQQRDAAFIWAAQCGKKDVVEFLLNLGVHAAVVSQGGTPLHSAVYGGQLEVVKFLLEHNAPLEIKNDYDGTVLGQALWCAYNNPKPDSLKIIDTLIAAGAKIEPGWEKYIDELNGCRE